MGLKLRERREKCCRRVRTGARFVISQASDAGIVLGAAAVAFGCWQHYPPAGYVVGGVLTMLVSYLLGGETVNRREAPKG